MLQDASLAKRFAAGVHDAPKPHAVDFKFVPAASGEGNDARIDIMSDGTERWYNGNPYPGPEFPRLK